MMTRWSCSKKYCFFFFWKKKIVSKLHTAASITIPHELQCKLWHTSMLKLLKLSFKNLFTNSPFFFHSFTDVIIYRTWNTYFWPSSFILLMIYFFFFSTFVQSYILTLESRWISITKVKTRKNERKIKKKNMFHVWWLVGMKWSGFSISITWKSMKAGRQRSSYFCKYA